MAEDTGVPLYDQYSAYLRSLHTPAGLPTGQVMGGTQYRPGGPDYDPLRGANVYRPGQAIPPQPNVSRETLPPTSAPETPPPPAPVPSGGPSLFQRGMGLLDMPFRLARAPLGALARAVARAQGLNVPATMDPGEMLQAATGLSEEDQRQQAGDPGALARAVGGEVMKTAGNLLTDPLGMALFGAGGLGAVPSAMRVASPLFKAQMAVQGAQQAWDAVSQARAHGLKSPEFTRAATGLGITGAMVAGPEIYRHVMTPTVRPTTPPPGSVEEPPPVAPAAPFTGEAASAGSSAPPPAAQAIPPESAQAPPVEAPQAPVASDAATPPQATASEPAIAPSTPLQTGAPETVQKPSPLAFRLNLLEATKKIKNLDTRTVEEGDYAGHVLLSTPKGVSLLVNPHGEIFIDPKAFEEGYGRPPTDKEIAAASYTALPNPIQVGDRMVHGLMTINGEIPPSQVPNAFFHDWYHAMERFLTDKQRAAVQKQFGGSETRAQGFADWIEGRGPDGTGFFAKIKQFADRLWSGLSPTWQSVFEDVRAGRGEAPLGAQAPTPTTGQAGAVAQEIEPPPVMPSGGGPLGQIEGQAAPTKAPITLPEELPRVLEEPPQLAATTPQYAAQPTPTPQPPPPSEVPPPGERKPPKLAQNIERFSQSSPEAKDMAAERLSDNADFYRDLKGKVTGDEMIETARQNGLGRDELTKRMEGRGLPNKDEFYQTRNLLDRGWSVLGDMVNARKALEADPSTTPEQLRAHDNNFTKELTFHNALLNAFLGKQAELARTLSFFNLMTDETAASSGFAGNMARVLRGRGATIDPAKLAEIQASITSGNRQLTRALMQDVYKFTTADKLYEGYVNGLLSAPTTFVVKGTSDLASLMWQGIRRDPAAILNKTFSRFDKTGSDMKIGETASYFHGVSEALGDAMKAFGQAWREEPVESLGESWEEQRPGAIQGTLGRVVRAGYGGGGSRGLRALDAFTKTLAQSAEKYAQAFRQAANEGGTVEEVNNRYRQIAQTPTENLADVVGATRAEQIKGLMGDAAKRTTFQKNLAGNFDQLNRAIGISPLRWIVPFRKISMNLAQMGFRLSPFKAIKALAYDIPTGAESPGEALVDPALGAMLVGVPALALVASGRLSGSGPVDKKEREDLMATGWQPNSVKVGDSWVSYARLEPFALPLKMIADAAEARDEKTATNMLTKGMGSMTEAFKLPMITGLEHLAEFFTNPLQQAKTYPGQLASGAIPAIVRRAASAIDPTQRSTQGALAPVISAIPGVSQTLPAKIGPGGEEVPRPIPIQSLFNPFTVSPELEGRQADVSRELFKIGVGATHAPKEIPVGSGKKVQLTPEEQEEFAKNANSRAASYVLDHYLPSGHYQSLPDTIAEAPPGRDSKESVVKEVYRKMHDAQRQLLMRMPDFRQRVKDAKEIRP